MDARSFANNDDETMPSQTRARAPTCWEPSKRHVAFAGIRLIVLTRIVLAEHPMPSPAAFVFSFFWASQRQSYPSVSSGCCQYRDCFRGTSARSLSHATSRIVCRGPYRHLSFVERAYSPSAARRSHNPNSILPSGPNQRERRESGCYASAPVQSTWHLNTPPTPTRRTRPCSRVWRAGAAPPGWRVWGDGRRGEFWAESADTPPCAPCDAAAVCCSPPSPPSAAAAQRKQSRRSAA